MTHYRLLVVGENFPMVQDGENFLMGWTTIRWVEAADQDAAKSKALDALRSDPQLANIPTGCGAEVSWEEIEEVDVSDVPATNPGFAFFPMEHSAT